MHKALVIAIGRTVQVFARLKGGGGSAFPGLVVEKIAPHFAVDILSTLPLGVVVISGTNGKTTTTKIVTELLESQGLRVFTNATGSNYMRGVIAALLEKVSPGGTLDADIAVLELDEAHGVPFARQIPPRFSLLLNVMRDQLDRFGEIDHTAELLAEIALCTTDTIVVNREDSRLATLCEVFGKKVQWFGLAPHLRALFPQDDELYGIDETAAHNESFEPGLPASVLLTEVQGSQACFELDGAPFPANLSLKGVYNAYNAAAALALARVILARTDEAEDKEGSTTRDDELLKTLSSVKSAFGRGESFTINDREIELLLVKNPGGFKLALESFDPQGQSIMIAINDDYRDGRDMSWLYDVDFSTLRETGVSMVSGVRAWDMALRLRYDEVPYSAVNTDVIAALDSMLADERTGKTPLRLYCTYTAMVKVHQKLSSYAHLKRVI